VTVEPTTDPLEPTPPARRHGLAALGVRNFQLYFAGQLVAQTGTWFQNLTIALLVVQVTGSASALALITVAQFGPMLLLAPVAGRVADTVRPRTVLIATSAGVGVITLALAWVVSAERPSLPLIYGLILLSGVVTAFDRVAAQAFVYELVGAELLQSGVVLSTVYISAARSIGPGLAGFAVLAVGPTVCLLINAASYLAVLTALLLVRPSRLTARPVPTGQTLSVLANAREAARNRPLLVLLIVNVVVTVCAYNFNVVLTTVVTLDFGGDAAALGAVHALNAVGAVLGGIAVAWAIRVRAMTVAPALVLFAIALAVNAAAPTLPLFLVAAPLLGVGLGVYQAVLNSAAQGVTPPHALGRTMSLLSQGNVGMAPVGALAIGLLIDATSGRTALVVATAACAVCAGAAWLVLRATSGRGSRRGSGGRRGRAPLR
jgi:MFS family permease